MSGVHHKKSSMHAKSNFVQKVEFDKTYFEFLIVSVNFNLL